MPYKKQQKPKVDELKKIDDDKLIDKLSEINLIQNNDVIPDSSISNIPLVERESLKNNLKTLGKRAQLEFNKQVAFAGYLIYIWNPEHIECELKPLPTIQPICRLASVNETYQLGKPALFFNGKPVFIVIRGIPYSIELKFTTKDKDVIALIEKGYSASEVDAKIHSVYTNSIFRNKRWSKMDALVYILSIITTALTTSIIFVVQR